MGVAEGVEESLVLDERTEDVAGSSDDVDCNSEDADDADDKSEDTDNKSENVRLGSIVVVEKVVGADVLNNVDDKPAAEDEAEQLSISAPGPEMGVRSTLSIPKSAPASSDPYDVTTILTVCVSPLTITGTPKGSQPELVSSSAPPQDTLSTKIWKPLK